MSPSENSCCSIESTKNKTSCCHSILENIVDYDNYSISPIKCCDIHQNQTQQNNISAPINEIGLQVINDYTDIYYFPKNQEEYIDISSKISNNTSAQINIPLLI